MPHVGTLHLKLVQDDGENLPLANDSPFRFGSDYTWNDSYTAYRCRPIRWVDDSSYIQYQAGLDIDQDEPEYDFTNPYRTVCADVIGAYGGVGSYQYRLIGCCDSVSPDEIPF